MSRSSISQRAILIAGLVFLFTDVSHGADVIGVVRDSVTLAPLSGVTVIAWDTADTTYTDASGAYHLTNVPTGGVTLVFGADNYNALSLSTSSCSCPHQGDMNEDGQHDAIDLNIAIQTYFFNGADFQDPLCPTTRADIDANGQSDAVDLNKLISLLFFNGLLPQDPCSP